MDLVTRLSVSPFATTDTRVLTLVYKDADKLVDDYRLPAGETHKDTYVKRIQYDLKDERNGHRTGMCSVDRDAVLRVLEVKTLDEFIAEMDAR